MVIAVASGKGGTGKTFFSTNLFYTWVCEGRHCQLADCDAEAPDAALFFQPLRPLGQRDVTQFFPGVRKENCTYCGICALYCEYNAILALKDFQLIEVMEEMCHGCGACLVACEHGAILEDSIPVGQVSTYEIDRNARLVEARMNVGRMTPVPVIKSAIETALNHPVTTTLLDAPPGTSCPFIHTVNRADFVILVTEPTPFGLSDLQHSVSALRKMEKSFSVVVNRAGIGNNDVYRWLESENITLLGEIPYDENIYRACSKGRIAAADNSGLRNLFLELTEKIPERNGSRIHQR